MQKEEENENINLIIWINGETAESSFNIKLNKSVNSIERLKNLILHAYKHSILNKRMDKAKLYKYTGLELDESDISYLENKQAIYLSLDGSPFNVLNYVYEHEFIKWIKEGGYGKVFLGRHVLNKDVLVAIKKISLNNLSTDEIYNISREALYLESFKHRNIIKFRNSFSYKENFYTVMDYANGGELNTYLYEKKYLSENEAKLIFKQVCDAVMYIHSKNVIHRDIKPNNILFLDEQRTNVMLIDFGLSGYNSGNVKEVVKAGTVKFTPPEFISGLSYNSTPKFDVWSLGVLLYFMLFGELPFDDENAEELNKKIVKDKLKFPNNIKVSDIAVKLIKKLLIKREALRIEMNDKMFEEWYNDINSQDKVIFCIDSNANAENEKKIYCISPVIKINSYNELMERKKRSSTLKVKTAEIVLKTNYLNLKNEISINKNSKSPRKDINLNLMNEIISNKYSKSPRKDLNINIKNEITSNKYSKSPRKEMNLYVEKLSLKLGENSYKKDNIIITGKSLSKSGLQLPTINIKSNK